MEVPMLLPKEYTHLRVYNDNEKFIMKIESQSLKELPDNELLIKVMYSSVNYKDALSCYGNRGVTKNYPHTPGIDSVGVIVNSRVNEFIEGDLVIVTSYDLGMNTNGGFSEYISVPASWAIHLPATLLPKEAMIYGTAGFTAGLSILELINSGITPSSGPVLVTGATGGVGSIALALLAKLNYDVVVATGRMEETEKLMELGASKVIHRDTLNPSPNKALYSEQWAGAIDTVGGSILSGIIKSTNYRGCVTCCGNVAGETIDLTVYPFILRGVKLVGVDSGRTPLKLREEIWKLLSNEWKLDNLELLANTISLSQLPDVIHSIYNGTHKHRTVVKL
jgi:acrylyl-CoA reductase (NADPH)